MSAQDAPLESQRRHRYANEGVPVHVPAFAVNVWP
jgi:hypothetical protein